MKIQGRYQITNAIYSIRQKQDTARGWRRLQSFKNVCVFLGVAAIVAIVGWMSYGSIAESIYTLKVPPPMATVNMSSIDVWSLVALQFGK